MDSESNGTSSNDPAGGHIPTSDPAGSDPAGGDPAGSDTPALDAAQKAALIEEFIVGDGRVRRKLLQQLKPSLTREDMVRLAPSLRDSSPRNAARITSLLAKFQLDTLFEQQLLGLKPGKVQILRQQFQKIRAG